jgi:predicted lipoprotein
VKAWWLLAACLLSSACVPWTVRPIDDSAQSADRPFDAAAYVGSIWQSKVLPAVAAARDLATMSPCANPCLVKGRGKVVRVDTASATGLATVNLEGGGTAVLQIGPVIRGTAVRDALPFIQFSQFVNQLEFARVGNALNDRVARGLSAIDASRLKGAGIEFSGAAVWAPGQPPEVVPVMLLRSDS